MRRSVIIDEQCHLRFKDLYGIAKEFSKACNVSFRDSFDYVLEFRDPKYSNQEIRQAVFKNWTYYSNSENRMRKTNPNSDVWVVFGETDQGKSTFINSLCEAQVAPEGKGIKSETKDVNLYSSKKHNLLLVDTPGLFDTRQITNQEISDEIVAKVQERLQENSHIKAIFFTWCPNFSLRLRLDEMLETLKTALGPSVIDSVVFLINKVSNQSTRIHEAVKEFANELVSKGLRNPIFVFDFKLLNASSTINYLKKALETVKSFRESDFESYRFRVCFKKYLDILELDAKKEQERQLIESRVSDKFKTQMQQMEQRHSEDIRRIQGQHSKELRERDEQMQSIERRVSDKFKTQMQQMEQRHSEDIQRIQETHSKELRGREETHYNKIKKVNDENSRQQQANADKIRTLEQNISNLQSNSSYYSYSYYPSYPSPSISSVLFQSLPTYSTPSSNNISTVSSTSSRGGKFYKGGQFTPGGGRAPKGGVWM